ncbi:MAG: hypothetical protein HY329_10150 [Chloroflexi bacterium]|nr:hypothetical protein [Chloroflexota bacterium]
MATFVILGRLTDQGYLDLAQALRQIQENVGRAEGSGLEIKGIYTTRSASTIKS